MGTRASPLRSTFYYILYMYLHHFSGDTFHFCGYFYSNIRTIYAHVYNTAHARTSYISFDYRKCVLKRMHAT